MVFPFLSVFKFLLVIVPSLICVAFFTLLERKVLGIIGYRFGPFKVSLGGIFQPLGDAGKLLNKEINSLSSFSFLFYYASSFFMMFSSMFLILMLSSYPFSVSFKFSIFLILILLGFNSLNSILAGWSIYSKFSLLGSLRTVSQLISYEVLLYVCLFFFFFLFFSFNLYVYGISDLTFFFLLSPFIFFVWFLSVLAELNRTPYDFSEGESELVSGFNVEFGSSSFTLIFLAEYSNIFFFMIITSVFFFLPSFFFPSFFFLLVLWVRGVLPRYRFDKLMGLSWKILLPQLGFFLVIFLVYMF